MSAEQPNSGDTDSLKCGNDNILGEEDAKDDSRSSRKESRTGMLEAGDFGTVEAFPLILRKMLDEAEQKDFQNIVSWQPDGRSFKIHKNDVFAATIMKNYFNLTKFKSFQKQLNLYRFATLHRGPFKGSYYHTLFVRDQPLLSKGITLEKGDSRDEP